MLIWHFADSMLWHSWHRWQTKTYFGLVYLSYMYIGLGHMLDESFNSKVALHTSRNIAVEKHNIVEIVQRRGVGHYLALQ